MALMLATDSCKTSSSARRVAKLLLDLRSIQFNFKTPYTWVSGIQSPVYCDNRKINSDVEVRGEILKTFIELIHSDFPEVETIAGVATGGIPMGVLIADRLKLPFIYVRQKPKEHGLMRQVEGNFASGDKILLIEDLVSTGGSSLKAIHGIRNEELDLLCLISVMTYGFQQAIDLFTNHGILHYSLCDLHTILEVAHDLGLLTNLERDSVLSFRANPKSWSNTK